MDGGAWWAAVRGVAESRTRLTEEHFHFHFFPCTRRCPRLFVAIASFNPRSQRHKAGYTYLGLMTTMLRLRDEVK